ncbi:TolC family protein [Leptolyngbya iicbica]|uniref:TolC family protein n=2 Tax=Cyanophyceae TaxID=3028117 RepID=A0A4Q7EEZ4_9CYAN|nr:TolC family protein [Leptolyngbya sp. LK]RZM81772.1 TolC family protein [Leptolyngbya sp. LK]
MVFRPQLVGSLAGSLVLLGAIAPIPAAANSPLQPTSTLPAMEASNDPPPVDQLPMLESESSGSAGDRPQVALNLTDLIQLVVVGNRDLRDRQLQRLIEQQQLVEAESRFDPRFTPAVGLGVTQTFEDDVTLERNLRGSIGGSSTEIGDRATLTQSAGVLGEVTTRQGTQIGLTLDALGDTPIGLRLTQPLLRGAGTAINEAPVEIARLQESQNGLGLQQTLIETVSTTVTQYTSLIQAQEAVAIQAQALARRQQQLEILTALVEAGRRAAVELADTRRSVANAERDLLVAQTGLEAANTALLDQLGTDQAVLFVAAADTVRDLFQAAVARVEPYDVETLVAIAYQQRPDYRQTLLAQDVAELNLAVAADDLRWQLNLEGDADLGDLSTTTVGLVARRTFDDPALETAQVRREVERAQQANRLAQQRIAIRNEITNRLNTVQTNLVRVDAARRATENARLQLNATRELFERGRPGGNLFQVISQEENLVEAQNQELRAEIEFLNSVVALDQSVGITLEIWQDEVNFAPALSPSTATEPLAPTDVTEIEVEAP